jgi:ABC-2 type transport system permease protein
MLAGSQLVQKGVVDGFLLFDEASMDKRNILYYVKGTGNMTAFRTLENVISAIIMEHHAKKLNITAEHIRSIMKETRIKMIRIGSEDTEMIEKYLAGIILVMMLFFAIFNSGGSFMRGISEEKNNRVIEILISSVTPGELMTGKILGLGCVGLTQIFIWGLLGAVFGGHALNFLSPFLLVCFAVYFIFGFLMYAGVFSVVGSVLSSEQDIQPVQAVLSMIGILPVALAILVLQDPDSLLVAVLSYVPLLTPTLMILRMVISMPSIIQIVSTMTVLFFSLIVTLHLASKIFHVALLMHGKKPSYREIMKWIRV